MIAWQAFFPDLDHRSSQSTPNQPEQQSRLRQYQVVGRHIPTETDPTPTVYRMKIFAPNEVCEPDREFRGVVAG